MKVLKWLGVIVALFALYKLLFKKAVLPASSFTDPKSGLTAIMGGLPTSPTLEQINHVGAPPLTPVQSKLGMYYDPVDSYLRDKDGNKVYDENGFPFGW